ncbi:MAG: Rossmann-like domain-containing protein [Beutenbergiaceae bacterium]
MAQLPESATVRAAAIAPIWTTVLTTEGAGMAMTPTEPYQRMELRGQLAGMRLPDLARRVTSWNVHESAAAMAAINAFRNQSRHLADDARVISYAHGGKQGVFGGFDPLLAGKKVAIVGHGPHVERLQHHCDLTVLERRPRPGDLPDPASEYVLPEQDFVFITASSFANKTLPRLLELSAHATTVVWGPSTPLCPALFELGVDALLGCVIDDADAVVQIAGEGGYFQDLHSAVTQVSWFRDPALADDIRHHLTTAATA